MIVTTIGDALDSELRVLAKISESEWTQLKDKAEVTIARRLARKKLVKESFYYKERGNFFKAEKTSISVFAKSFFLDQPQTP